MRAGAGRQAQGRCHSGPQAERQEPAGAGESTPDLKSLLTDVS